MNRNKILYISTHNVDTESGVEHKIQGFCNSARANGFKVERLTQYCRSIKQRRQLLRESLKSDSKIWVIRSFGFLTFAVIDILYRAKMQGRILICDQPTPLSVTLKEVWNSKTKGYKKLYNLIFGIVSGPWSFSQYHRIIEYAPEGLYFKFGNVKKIKLIGNGIDINRISLRHHDYRENSEIKIVGVANTSISHGYDRMIKAISIFNKTSDTKVIFEIIGGALDSPIINSLRGLVEDLAIKDYVSFSGFQNQSYISKAYDQSDIAVGALGLYRVGLHVSSILKVREYCLAGIPFITSGEDPDFPNKLPFRIVVPNDDSVDSIVNALYSFQKERSSFSDESIRDYAIANLGYDKKFNQMMEGLL